MRSLLLASCAAFAACAPVPPAPVPLDVVTVDEPSLERGHALFAHNWVLGDEWSVQGDGLGPHFNATSCVACHAQGGVGGSGANHHNVMPFPKHAMGDARANDRAIAMNALAGLGLRGGSVSNVFGPGDAISGPRNSTALFGAGLIDGIADEDIVAAAAGDPRFPQVKGQVARTPEGRVGRFGWKADVPLLGEFVARACAIELGLEVPGVPQGGAPAAKGVDLAHEDVIALTAFVATLPAPVRAEHSMASRAGERIFDDVGCTACHREQLGNVEGIYSDLLLHDLGPQLADGAGSWGAPVTSTVAQLWRTPPLWGVRDSGPWLHDGRAQTLDDAISAHGGEAQTAAFAWRALSQADRFAVRAFLETLVAPGSV